MRPLLRHPLSFAGAVLTTLCALLFVVFFAAETMGLLTNPYLGLLVFVALPVGFLMGLALIPLGLWRHRRQLAAGRSSSLWPTLDLNSPRHRQVTAIVFVLTCINVVIVSLAAFSGVHYMDSTEFCGTVCHEVMEPEHEAFKVSAHSGGTCVQCHIGPGAQGFVKAKLAGTRQLLAVATNDVARPVPAPVHNLVGADLTCARCHAPDKFHGEKLKTFREYGDDEANTPSESIMQLHLGGGSDRYRSVSGIHWHTSGASVVEYVATDAKRETIPWVRVTHRDGTVREYVAEGVTAETIAGGERRRMDCVDCHNRVGHTFAATPQRAVDAALTSGDLPSNLPFVRRESVAALSAEYTSQAAALDAIATRLRAFYQDGQGSAARDRGADIVRAIDVTQALYRRNVFPAMKVGFGTYPSHLGHIDSTGCFRCHDDSKKSQDGRVISQSCDLCHEQK